MKNTFLKEMNSSFEKTKKKKLEKGHFKVSKKYLRNLKKDMQSMYGVCKERESKTQIFWV